YVVGSVMQSAASLESEIWEIYNHGPGHHLGSNGVDQQARDLLLPYAKKLERKPALEKYRVVLHLLGKAPMDPDEEPVQDAMLVIGLRNEIMHYKSRWGADLASEKLFK